VECLKRVLIPQGGVTQGIAKGLKRTQKSSSGAEARREKEKGRSGTAGPEKTKFGHERLR